MKRLIIVIILSILALTLLTSCEPTKYEKPFIIVGKQTFNSSWVEYTYQDINGCEQTFTDVDKYNIGDTLK